MAARVARARPRVVGLSAGCIVRISGADVQGYVVGAAALLATAAAAYVGYKVYTTGKKVGDAIGDVVDAVSSAYKTVARNVAQAGAALGDTAGFNAALTGAQPADQSQVDALRSERARLMGNVQAAYMTGVTTGVEAMNQRITQLDELIAAAGVPQDASREDMVQYARGFSGTSLRERIRSEDD